MRHELDLGLPKSYVKLLLKQELMNEWQKNSDETRTTDCPTHYMWPNFSTKGLWSKTCIDDIHRLS